MEYNDWSMQALNLPQYLLVFPPQNRFFLDTESIYVWQDHYFNRKQKTLQESK